MFRARGLLVAGLLGTATLVTGCKGLFDRDEGAIEETREDVKDKAGKAKKDVDKGVGGSGQDKQADEKPKR